MEYMHELKDMLCDELEKIAEDGELTAGSLETIDKLTHSIKSIATIMAMEDSEYSNDDGMNSYRGNSYRGGPYAQRRDSRGRYSRMNRGSYARGGRRGGYSRDDESEKLVEKLERMMEKATDQKAKTAIQEAIEAIEM